MKNSADLGGCYSPRPSASVDNILLDLQNSSYHVDNSLDAFNDLLLACLDYHTPIKTAKMRHKPNPFITEDIRDLMKAGERSPEGLG